MKKVLIPIFLSLILGLVAIFLVSNNKVTDIEFYTLRENYSFVSGKDRKMTFNVYSKTSEPIIMYPEANSYLLKLEEESFTLTDVECECIDYQSASLVKISASYPELSQSEYISEKCELYIINGSYTLTLDLGTISILDEDTYTLLKLDALSATYSKINGSYELTGVNLTLTNSYKFLTSFRIGGFSYGTLSRAKFDFELESEAEISEYIINYDYKKYEESYTLGLKSKKLFIPIGYLKECFIKSGYLVLTLDGKNYYFDNFPFMTTDPTFSKYEDKMIKGERSGA